MLLLCGTKQVGQYTSCQRTGVLVPANIVTLPWMVIFCMTVREEWGLIQMRANKAALAPVALYVVSAYRARPMQGTILVFLRYYLCCDSGVHAYFLRRQPYNRACPD